MRITARVVRGDTGDRPLRHALPDDRGHQRRNCADAAAYGPSPGKVVRQGRTRCGGAAAGGRSVRTSSGRRREQRPGASGGGQVGILRDRARAISIPAAVMRSMTASRMRLLRAEVVVEGAAGAAELVQDAWMLIARSRGCGSAAPRRRGSRRGGRRAWWRCGCGPWGCRILRPTVGRIIGATERPGRSRWPGGGAGGRGEPRVRRRASPRAPPASGGSHRRGCRRSRRRGRRTASRAGPRPVASVPRAAPSCTRQASIAPPNVSPAPTVSTTSTGGTATSPSAPATRTRTGRPPSVTSTARAPGPRSGRGGGHPSSPGRRNARSSTLTLTRSARARMRPMRAR